MQFNIGIIQCYVLITFHILFALTFYFDSGAEDPDIISDLLYIIVYTYAYISVLLLIRKIVYESPSTRNLLTWITRLEVLRVLSSILVSLDISLMSVFESVFALALVGLYISFTVNVFKKEHKDTIEISGLRSPIIALMIVFSISIVSVSFLFLVMADGIADYLIMIFLIMAVPYIFIIRYLMNMNVQKKGP